MAQTVESRRAQDVLEKLVTFRNDELGNREQMMLDAVLARAFAPVPPTEPEVAALAAKIEAFEQTLPEEERRLVDAILTRGSRSEDESEVEPHLTWLWDQYGDAAMFPNFEAKCLTDGGVWAQAVPAPLWYWPTRAKFSCWAW
jgi:hypothetical protein